MQTVSRLVRIEKIVTVEVVGKARFYLTFDYFGNKRKVRDCTADTHSLYNINIMCIEHYSHHHIRIMNDLSVGGRKCGK